ncbi:hypothetical protein AAHZ94_07150 [Streptomyces sp. HSW2009]|uniref:hypothetical protein n=1 Tax=Streptomyces sp. HSW2009 TaxID=3142890 RepID=UPI0032EBEF2E
MGDARTAEVRLVAHSDRFAADDDRWQEQVLLLHTALAEATGLMEHRPAPGLALAGTKGSVLPLVIGLTGPAVAGVVAAIAAWLGRDRGRSVHLAWSVDGRAGEFTVTGSTIDNATLRTALEHGLRAATEEHPPTGDEPTAPDGAPSD